MSDESRGVYRKYEVRRVSDPTGKHANCTYFVLDLAHDAFALPALKAYANACAKEFPELAKDIRRIITTGPCGCRSVGECFHRMSPQTPAEALAEKLDESEGT